MSSVEIDKESKLVVIETTPRRVDVSRSGTPGPAGLRWRDDVGSGAWTVDTTYAVRDACAYAGASYRCLVAHVATADNTPGTLGGAAYWAVVAAKGTTGTPATIEIGTVTTGAPGSEATVENVGTPAAVVLEFTIPKGPQGLPGLGDMQTLVYDP
nr:carbohydrate-binding protein [Mesorhizobium sp.]